MITLRRFASAGRGAGFPHEFQGQSEADLPFFKVSDFNLPGNERTLIECTNWVSMDTARHLRAEPVPAGSVLLPKIGAALLGNARRITTRESLFDNNVMAVVPERIDSRYVHYWLSTIDMKELAQPGPVPSLAESAVLDLSVPVANQEMQRAIADFLDPETARIDALIAKKEELSNSLVSRVLTFARAAFDSMPTAVPLRRVISRIQTGTTPGGDASYMVDDEGEIEWLTPVDFTRWLEIRSAARRVRHEAVAERHVPLFPKDSVVIVGIGATAGKVGHLDRPASSNQQVTCIVTNDRLSARLLAWQLSVRQSEIRDIAPYTTLPILNNDFLKSLQVRIPDRPQQDALLKALDAAASHARNVTLRLDHQIRLLKEHRQAFITAAVTGQLDISNAA